MVDRQRSFLEISRHRQRAAFVARDSQIELFRRNLKLPAGDERRRQMFNVFGDGGVGKSSLLDVWRGVAGECGAITAGVDERVYGVPESLWALTDQMGDAFKAFRVKYTTYLRRRDQLERDPHAPRDVLSQVIQSTVRVGFQTVPAVAGLGPISPAFADLAAESVELVRTYVARKLRDGRDVRLVLNPIGELTRAFVAGLAKAANACPVALHFDTFEVTGLYLEAWLYSLVRDQYGRIPPNVVFTVAGRSRLDPSRWSEFSRQIVDVPLAPFSQDELRQFLRVEAVTDERTVQLIYRLSRGLPLLANMLARNRPLSPSDVDDPAVTAVDLFLKWEKDGQRREAALAGALPRRLSLELLAAVMMKDDISSEFGWLTTQSFVSLRSGRYQYHDEVRLPMLRALRARAPRSWQEAHGRLAEVYQRWLTELELANGWQDATWFEHKVEETYHRLCAHPPDHRCALANGVAAARLGLPAARRWADLVRDAGNDADSNDLRELGNRLTDSVGADAKGCLEFLLVIASSPALEVADSAVAFTEIGKVHYRQSHNRQAVEACSQAIDRDPQCGEAYAVRAAALVDLRRQDEALTDIERALEVAPQSVSTLSRCADVYSRIARHDEALTLFTRALALQPNDAWSLGSRAQTYRALKRYDNALADLNLAVRTSPGDLWLFVERGSLYGHIGDLDSAMADFAHAIKVDAAYAPVYDARAELNRSRGTYDQALPDHDKAVELDPDAWNYNNRGETNRLMGKFEQAITDFTRAIELDDYNGFAFLSRGQAYGALRRYDEALSDLSKAIELGTYGALSYLERGDMQMALGKYEQAAHDYAQAIERDPTSSDGYARAASLYKVTSNYDETITYLTRAIQFDQNSGWLFSQRAEAHRLSGHLDLAIVDFSRSIELAPTAYAYGGRGQAHLAMTAYDEAIDDLQHATVLERDYAWVTASLHEACKLAGKESAFLQYYTQAIDGSPDDASLLAARGEAYAVAGDNAAAVSDFTRALRLHPKNVFALRRRALIYAAMGDFERAAADHKQAALLDPTDAWSHANLGETYRLMARYKEALQSFDEALELNPTYAFALGSRGQTRQALQDYDGALADLTRAIDFEPGTSWLYEQRGHMHSLNSSYEEAFADFNKAIELDHDSAYAYGRRGQVHLVLCHYHQALADLTHAVELDPDLAWLYLLRGDTYAGSCQYRDAIADISEAIRREPEMGAAYARRALIHRMLGQLDKAIDDYTEAINRDHDRAWAGLARTHLQKGRLDDALACANRSVEGLQADNYSLYVRATVKRRLGRYEEALSDARQALGLEGADSTDHYLIATILMAQDNPAAQAAIREAEDIATSELSHAETKDIGQLVLTLCSIAAGDIEKRERQMPDMLMSQDLLDLRDLREEIEFLMSVNSSSRTDLPELHRIATTRLDAELARHTAHG